MKEKKNEVKELLEKAYDLMDASRDKFIGVYVGENEHISSYACGNMDNVSAIVAATVSEAFDKDNEGDHEKTFYGNAIVEGICKLIAIPDETGLRILRKITAAMMVATLKTSIRDKFGIDVDKDRDEDGDKDGGHVHDCENCNIHDKCPLDDAIAWRRKNGNNGGGRNNRRQKNNKKHNECGN